MNCLTITCPRSVSRRTSCCMPCSRTGGREHSELCQRKQSRHLSRAKPGPDPDRAPNSVFRRQPRHKRVGLTTDQLLENLRVNHYGPATEEHPGAVSIQCRELGMPTGDMGRPGCPGNKEYSDVAKQAQGEDKPVAWNEHGYFYATNRDQCDHMINHCRKVARKWGEKLAAAQRVQNALTKKLWS